MPLLVVGTVCLLAGCSPGPVDVDAPTPGRADQQACQRFLDDVPETLADQPRRETDPAGGLARAWGDPAIVVTCGGSPLDLPATASCLTVNGVDWYLPDDQVAGPGEAQGTVTLTTVKREQTVALELPGEYWPPATALADLADSVKHDIPATGKCR